MTETETSDSLTVDTKTPPEENSSNLGRFSWTFAKNYRVTLIFWVIILIMGFLSYTTLLPREGFPPIEIPVGAINGTYFIDDAEQVDEDIVQPLGAVIETFDSVDTYQAESNDNGFLLFVTFNEGVDAEDEMKLVASALKDQVEIPDGAQYNTASFDPSLFDNQYNLLVAVYENENSDLDDLEAKAAQLSERLAGEEAIDASEVVPVVETVTNPTTGEEVEKQTSINKVGIREGNDFIYYPAVSIGVEKSDDVDDIELSESVKSVIGDRAITNGSEAKITADFATSINQQIDSLQRSLLIGLVAVIIVALLLISWRAALVIALFIPTVLAGSFFGLNLLGYTLNTITLFAIILTLGLFVDDATIVVEAVDAQRDKSESHKKSIKAALRRVGIATIAGTLTTILVFAPMLAISGILGSFIRLLPITVMLALTISLVISLTIVPFLTRPLLLSGSRKKTFLDKLSILDPVEKWCAKKLAKLPLLNRDNKKKGRIVTTLMVGLSIVAIIAAGLLASNLRFDIFPQAKDGDFLQASIDFAPQTSIAQAEEITNEVDARIEKTVGENLEYVTYTSADERRAFVEIGLVPFGSRGPTAHDIVDDLEAKGKEIDGATIKYSMIGAGPPTTDFPFEMRVFVNDPQAFDSALPVIEDAIDGAEVDAGSKTTTVAEVKIEGLDTLTRTEGGQFATVLARFADEDLNSGAVLALQDKIKDQFDEDKLQSIGLAKDALDFDVGQEAENAESFNSLGTGLIAALLLMYLLLVILFKSFSQPLLIFMAIPFSLFGVFFGLTVTDNALSFFVMLALLGLIGIVVNNSILLTEYANQERENGADRHDAISRAVKDRFRPLVTTTLTTVCALLPLALTDPFWQSLAYTLIFGIISSTTLIILSFPYYYLLFERIREFKNRKVPFLK